MTSKAKKKIGMRNLSMSLVRWDDDWNDLTGKHESVEWSIHIRHDNAFPPILIRLSPIVSNVLTVADNYLGLRLSNA